MNINCKKHGIVPRADQTIPGDPCPQCRADNLLHAATAILLFVAVLAWIISNWVMK
jgi:hypothetical protein